MALRSPNIDTWIMDDPASTGYIVSSSSAPFLLHSNITAGTGATPATDGLDIAGIIAGDITTNVSHIYPVVHPDAYTHLELFLALLNPAPYTGAITAAPTLRVFGASTFKGETLRPFWALSAAIPIPNEYYTDSTVQPPRKGDKLWWHALVPNETAAGTLDVIPELTLAAVIADDASNRLEVYEPTVIPLKGAKHILTTVTVPGTTTGTTAYILGRFVGP